MELSENKGNKEDLLSKYLSKVSDKDQKIFLAQIFKKIDPSKLD
jgi:hypothetical protein